MKVISPPDLARDARRRRRSRPVLAMASILVLGGLMPAGAGARAAGDGPEAKVRPKLDFNRDIRPILSDHCFACHGPDPKARKAGLRLDRKVDALRDREGHAAIVPGDVEASDLAFRIEAEDNEVRMPPPESREPLTAAQAETLKRWIAQGAPWKEHWAFLPPERPPLPEVRDPSWPSGPIDRFILARLEAEGLRPMPEADRATLIRRATLDLTGLPPTPAEVDAFLADRAPDAFEKVVDRLLRSPHYGEHMARYWLDAARYGDTHGLHLDNYREIWPYRDWVIRAFNGNMPFDRFVVEQLAGDLLPGPTTDQLVATGFNRCNVTTGEGGSIEEEVYVRNVLDRVETAGTVFMGLTIGCARCHDHKFDPVTQKDFYRLFAFFNSIDGNPLDGNVARHPPVVPVPSPEQAAAMEGLRRKVASIRAAIAGELAKISYDEAADPDPSEYVRRADYVWFDDDLPPGAKATAGEFPFAATPDHPVLSGGRSVVQAYDALGQHVFEGATSRLRVGEGDTLFAHVFLDPTRPPKEVMLQWHADGWKHRAYWGENVIDWGKDGTPERLHAGPLPATGKWVRLEVEAARLGLSPGTTIDGLAFTQHGGTAYWDRAGIETWTPQEGQVYDSLALWVRSQRALGAKSLPKEIQDVVKLDRGKRGEAQKKLLRDYFVEHAYSKARPTFDPLRRQLAEAEKERDQLDKQIPASLVFRERKEPKPAFVLKRGEYDQKGEKVERELPAFLPPLPEGAPRDRLGLARWLVAPGHPLTARVAANRFWQQCFGTGIVKTAEDFGAQGEPPSHPELLDWLAVRFREDGWDVKAFMKRLVMSSAYRQSSRVTPDRLAKDPANRLLSRGPRFRLDAEMLRDQALAVGGLLVERIGGPSVKPPQPAGLWEAVGYTRSDTAKFVADVGPEKVHRRSLYTFWKRTSPPPQMTAFDAPSREACLARRERTNTPLQALVLLNEPQFVEASRALAERALREGGPTPESRVESMFRLATGRRPDAGERAELLAAYRDLRAGFAGDPQAAGRLIATGETKPDGRLDPVELAAWTMIGNLLLNLDEVTNKG
jgi:hypothetical protein